MTTFVYAAGAAAAAALVFAIIKYGAIMKRDAGDAKMQEISKQIQQGAAAFLKAEYKWLTVFVIAVGAAIFFSKQQGLGQDTAIAFVAGAA
ncbi:MAG: sodium/proton-translocating pyrophosphatase, partial [Planctomycetota bacterium]